jgi:hypothetical protein
MRRGYDHDDDLAQCLHRSAHTVRTQVASIFRKLEVRSRSAVLSLLQRVDAHLDSELPHRFLASGVFGRADARRRLFTARSAPRRAR